LTIINFYENSVRNSNFFDKIRKAWRPTTRLPNFFKGSQTQNTSSEKNAFEVFKLQNAKNGIFMNPEKKNF